MKSHAPAHTHSLVPKQNTSFESTPIHLKATSAAHAASGGSGDSILRTVIGLVIVIAVIYGLTWVVRRVKGTERQSSSGEGLERVATLALASDKSVSLVRVGSELHLLGVAENAVTSLRRFSEDEALELGLPVVPPGAGNAPRGGGVRMPAEDVPGDSPGGSWARFELAGTLDSLRRFTQR